MKTLTKLELREIKRGFNAHQRTLCKKFEQYGGSMRIILEDKDYKLTFKSTSAYLEYIDKRNRKK